MPAPAIIVHTWARNAARQLHVWYDDKTVSPTVPLTTGTVVLVIVNVATGATIGTYNGAHIALGEWKIDIPALGLAEGLIVKITVTATKGGTVDESAWYAKLVDPQPPITPP